MLRNGWTNLLEMCGNNRDTNSEFLEHDYIWQIKIFWWLGSLYKKKSCRTEISPDWEQRVNYRNINLDTVRYLTYSTRLIRKWLWFGHHVKVQVLMYSHSIELLFTDGVFPDEISRDSSETVQNGSSIGRGELSYLAPLGSENISAPYFKQCFFGGGYYPSRLSQTPRLPVPRQK